MYTCMVKIILKPCEILRIVTYHNASESDAHGDLLYSIGCPFHYSNSRRGA
jgi:hypothetical protein